MAGYVLRRLGQFVVVLALGSVAIWSIILLIPGSPAVAIVGMDATPEQLAAAEQAMGLDRPVWVQYLAWLERVAQLDLGRSLVNGVPVGEQLAQRIPATLQLAGFTVAISLLAAFPMGIVVALRPRSVPGVAISVFQAVTLAVPTFWVGILLVLLFSIEFRLLPSVSRYVPVLEDPLGAFRNTILPALSLAFYFASVLSRFVAASLRDVLAQDYLRMARAKGVPERRVILAHALRNALLPIVTIIGLQIGGLLGGAIVIEAVFSYPGLGRLLFSAVVARDYPVVQGAILFAMLGFLTINLLVDILYARLDPRITLA
jgi:peptide/nickel transport system permease protein